MSKYRLDSTPVTLPNGTRVLEQFQARPGVIEYVVECACGATWSTVAAKIWGRDTRAACRACAMKARPVPGGTATQLNAARAVRHERMRQDVLEELMLQAEDEPNARELQAAFRVVYDAGYAINKTKKLGRPKLGPDERKTEVLQIRLTKEERELLDKAAAILGVTVSAFILSAALEEAERVLGNRKAV